MNYAKGRIQIVRLPSTSPYVSKEALARFNSVNIGDFVSGQFFTANADNIGARYISAPFEGIVASRDLFCFVTDKMNRHAGRYAHWKKMNQEMGHTILVDQDNQDYDLAGRLKARALVIIKKHHGLALPKHKDLKDGYVVGGINIWNWAVIRPCDVNSLLTHECERVRKVGLWLTSDTPGEPPNVLRY